MGQSWNFRAIIHDHVELEEYEEDFIICIHEVYYDTEGNIDCWTENPVYPCGEDKEDLLKELERMAKAVNGEILSMKELIGSVKK